MSTYTMAQIVALTGIKAHTLRKWETRYGFLEPERTDTNIRYYTDNQLKKLMNISILTRNGYRISKIDNMSEADIHAIISNTLIQGKSDDDISALILSTLEMDEVTFDKILQTQIKKNGLLNTTTNIIYPFLEQVGVLWGINKVMPAQEHFVSNVVKKKMFAAIDSLPHADKDAPVILMFLIENELHEMGLLLAYFIARKLGWKVYYLGQNVPLENIEEVIKVVNPNLLLSMFVTPTQEPIQSKIDAVLQQTEVPFLVSGNPELIKDVAKDEQLTYLSQPEDLVTQLQGIAL